jgi:hypothetical protein
MPLRRCDAVDEVLAQVTERDSAPPSESYHQSHHQSPGIRAPGASPGSESVLLSIRIRKAISDMTSPGKAQPSMIPRRARKETESGDPRSIIEALFQIRH